MSNGNIIYPVDFSDMTWERANEVANRIEKNLTTWLCGLEHNARVFTRAMLMLVEYSDKLTRRKQLKQPWVQFRGPTGTGKTDLVMSAGMSIAGKFSRIQCFPTTMPEDITGYTTIEEQLDGTRKVVFKMGPIFANVVLIDESNRAPARTKAALLELGEEGSATIPDLGGSEKVIPVYPVSGDINDIYGPRYFLLCTTQNIFGEEEGTFENPMAERDRTTLSILMMDPDREEDERLINSDHVLGKKIEPVTDPIEMLKVACFIHNKMKVSESARQYRARVIRNTRSHRAVGKAKKIADEFIKVWVTPRANFPLESFAKVEAFFDGRKVVEVDHIKSGVLPVLGHRIVLKEEVALDTTPEEVLEKIMKATDIPPWL